MKLIFFGSGQFAVPTLKRLQQCQLVDRLTVITQPDRPAGRRQLPQPTPVKLAAELLGLTCTTTIPQQLDADIGVVVYYGTIIPERVLQQFPLGILNIHPSLLPAYRGPAPIKRALLHDERVTGVTIMKLAAGVDTGPILAQERVAIADTDTNETLEQTLALVGAELLLSVLPGYAAGARQPQPQTTTGVSYAARLDRSAGELLPTDSPRQIWNKYRALQPWPGVFFQVLGQRIKVTKMIWQQGGPIIQALQPAGKLPMTLAQFRQGYPTISFPHVV